jgi:hypothetical protein
MSATNLFETSVIKFAFQNVTDANWTALTAATEFYVSLHTGSPGDAGTQATNETAYTGYQRKAVDRDNIAWTESGGTVTITAELAFDQCSASPGAAITYTGLGLEASGATALEFYAELDNPVTMQVGTVPIFSASELTYECD